ncbi:unnamed protein product [Moneuplotes crassus]|uniref:Uncharacterized protein n=1 Tax=Euplotes crassus TaxID=5936 RepID=A0AAD1UEI8_EUPCR|nr:unnamed protein product [Moneuplotes crassus]
MLSREIMQFKRRIGYSLLPNHRLFGNKIEGWVLNNTSLVKHKDSEGLPQPIVIEEDDNILVRKKKNRENTVQLTEYLKTRDIKDVTEVEKQEIVARIRATLPKRRGIVNAIKPYIKEFDELTEEQKYQMIDNYLTSTELMNKMNLTLKELQYIEDEDYYVDIEEELKKDLYEKQRVIDDFVIEHEEERKDLLGFFENMYFKAQPNKFAHIVYANQFNLTRVRAALSVGCFNTALATVCLGMVHPLLPVILAYDYYQIIKYCFLLNSTVLRMRISKTKQKIFLERLNFLGYWKKPKNHWSWIRDCKFVGKTEYKGLNPNSIGLLPSLNALKRLFNKVSSQDQHQSQRYKRKVQKTGGEFCSFYHFMCKNKNYYIPTDMVDRSKSILNEDLVLQGIMNGDLNRVHEYDFYHHDEEILINREESREGLEDFGYENHIDLLEEENRKKRAYMKYHPNRDYNGRYGNEALKKPMGDDGTFIDNGYR